MCPTDEYRSNIEQLISVSGAMFMATFCRFEFALKRSGYLTDETVGAKAQANWDTFACDLGLTFLATCNSQPSVSLLFTAPPTHLLVLANKAVDWSTHGRQIDRCQDLFLCIRDIRNNLLHGEKKTGHDRDTHLVNAAQVVLDLAWCTANANTEN